MVAVGMGHALALRGLAELRRAGCGNLPLPSSNAPEYLVSSLNVPVSGTCRDRFVWKSNTTCDLILLLLLPCFLSLTFCYRPNTGRYFSSVSLALCLLIQCWLLVKGI